jgi:hypothetical protein
MKTTDLATSLQSEVLIRGVPGFDSEGKPAIVLRFSVSPSKNAEIVF